MDDEQFVAPVEELPPGRVTGVGQYAVGDVSGEYFAVGRRCRHLGADLASGKIDEAGHLVCPWHQAAYDVQTGSMVRGPQGVFAKIPGLDAFYRAFTKIMPLKRGRVSERDRRLYVR